MSDTMPYVTTLRLPAELAGELDLAARIDDVSASEFIRQAITAFITERRNDPLFQSRVQERIEADRRILDRLGGTP